MGRDKKPYEVVRNGDSTYYRLNYKDQEMRRLRTEWEEFGYCKFSTLEDQMEWAIMEVLLIDDLELSFVGSSGIDYPSIYYDDVDTVRKIVAAARTARALRLNFVIPKRKSSESLRIFQARVADQLDRYLSTRMDNTDASIVGDFYLARCIKDPPPGYDE